MTDYLNTLANPIDYGTLEGTFKTKDTKVSNIDGVFTLTKNGNVIFFECKNSSDWSLTRGQNTTYKDLKRLSPKKVTVMICHIHTQLTKALALRFLPYEYRIM